MPRRLAQFANFVFTTVVLALLVNATFSDCYDVTQKKVKWEEVPRSQSARLLGASLFVSFVVHLTISGTLVRTGANNFPGGSLTGRKIKEYVLEKNRDVFAEEMRKAVENGNLQSVRDLSSMIDEMASDRHPPNNP
jgi:hypothetical protein